MTRFWTRWGILFEPYTSTMYGWQVVVLLRRVVCVILDTFILSNLQWKMVGLAFLHFAALQIGLKVKPYQNERDNHLEFFSFTVLVILSTLQTAEPISYSTWIQIVISVCITGSACLFISLFAFTHIRTYFQKRRQANTDVQKCNLNVPSETCVVDNPLGALSTTAGSEMVVIQQ